MGSQEYPRIVRLPLTTHPSLNCRSSGIDLGLLESFASRARSWARLPFLSHRSRAIATPIESLRVGHDSVGASFLRF